MVSMVRNQAIPLNLEVGGYHCKVSYYGQAKECDICEKTDHIAKDCPFRCTAKKVAFTRLENYRLTSQNATFCVRSFAFSDCKIRGFPFVFLTVNSSFRSIIRQFSTTVNTRKTSRFSGVHRMVNALKTDCFPLFSRRFPVTKQRVNWYLWEFSLIDLMFTARLTHGIQVVFQCFLVFPSYKTTHSLEFSVTFLAFSRTVNARKMPENRLFFSVHQLVNT